jgi:aminoglycoside/choline kinase family phosphotransferase
MVGLKNLYTSHYGGAPEKMEEIPLSVSARRYFRISRGAESCIGTYSPDTRETRAFVTYSQHFRESGIHVPEVYAVSDDLNYYLQTDLGDVRLFEIIISRESPGLDESVLHLYRLAIDQLLKIQLEGDEGLDYSVAVPRSSFDRQSVMWDLNHFKYYFLKPSGIPFDEQLLEEGFELYAGRIAMTDLNGFMLRDFQSRNIMIKGEDVYLIDFQGGRKGPVQYDLASLVFDSRADLTETDRGKLIDYYFNRLREYRKIDYQYFISEFYMVALVRILQALGAYGLRGNIEKKAVFLQSIPHGLKNLGYILEKTVTNEITDYFRSVLNEVVSSVVNYRLPPEPSEGLTVTIYSFSYRKPLPDDLSGNGGGFVFDCRFLKNPGRFEEYRSLNGFDPGVIAFLEKDPVVDQFLSVIRQQLGMAINSYQNRGYRNLMVSFGCTGGQHRSVYCAHSAAEWIRSIEGVRVIEIHRELDLTF